MKLPPPASAFSVPAIPAARKRRTAPLKCNPMTLKIKIKELTEVRALHNKREVGTTEN
jgi:hypothetical protein